MTEKLTPKELIYLDEAIEEMNKIKYDKEIIAIEKWLEQLLKKRNDIDNQILLYQIKHNMSWPFDICEILKIIPSN